MWFQDELQISVLVLLDLSAAFNTVDHPILLNKLSGTSFKWFNSYLTDRKFMVSMDTCSLGVHEIKCGVP